ncbi:hypothetical protein E1B28_010565 [Marasmius oreades]|uniref:F-box domain-containing protein n=1 Tax=Marasmius oreades TaxID=181124 RepID=A0A9P7RYK6_9AGAR|nr:uncharacterized protein E1B28_010565 [Marasmius oreades]KAG7091536.1 hypothetical protein E1B28_010565 [Marasmius oreades]
MNTFPDIRFRALKSPMKPDELLANLRHNVLPSFPREISHFTRNARHDLNLYDELIQHIRNKKATLSREITRYESLTTPIRKLPPEVLRQIFGFAAGRSRFNHPFSACQSTAFRLSSVCYKWREIALQSPELWANMCISLDAKSILPVKLSLSRSQQHTLSIELVGGYEGDEEQPCEELLRLLVEHNHRWRELDLSLVGSLVLDSDLGGFNSMLESVICSSVGLHSLSFKEDENLQSFTLNMEPEYPIYHDDFPWETIRHLNTKYGNLQHVLECLQHGRGLLSLTYRDDQDSALTYNFPSQRVDEDRVVSNLGTLSLELSNPSTLYPLLSDILQNVTLPSLKNLTISCETLGVRQRISRTFQFCHMWPAVNLSLFMERSRCNLTTLVLTGIPLLDSQVISMLHLTPSLHTFTLHELWATETTQYQEAPKKLHRTVTKDLLEKLEATYSNAFYFQHPLLPKLKWLTLWVQSHFDADEAFVELVKSRWVRPASGDPSFAYDTEHLRTVELYVLGRKLLEEVYEPLKTIEENGMMITVFGDGVRVV